MILICSPPDGTLPIRRQGADALTFHLHAGERPCGWLYVGVTNDLVRRVDEHKLKVFDGYTAEHGIDQLVWFEEHAYIDRAIQREKRINAGPVSGSSRWWKRPIPDGPISTLAFSRLGLWPSGS